jgi:hypothetical protein
MVNEKSNVGIKNFILEQVKVNNDTSPLFRQTAGGGGCLICLG